MNKILIVDDQEQNLYLLKTLLEGHGYEVVEARNGAAALELARRDPPDLTVSDILMPVMDGFALCQEWKNDEQLKNIPFVFYTATYTDPKDEELALSLGASRFIVKPVETEEFISILEQVIAEVESGVLPIPQETLREEMTYYRMYNESLIRKLEDKMLELEKVNLALEEDVAKRKQTEMEMKRLFEESQRRLKQVEALHSIDLAISASMDLRMTLNILLQYVQSLLRADAADILLLIPNSQQFNFSAGRGFQTDSMERTNLRFGTSFAGRVALERKTIVMSGGLAAQTDREFSKIYEREGFVAYIGVPLIVKGQIKGVLEVYYRSTHQTETEWLNLLETLAGRAAIAIDNAQLFTDLQQSNLELTLAYDATIAGWSRAMDLHDKEAEGHTQRVTDLTLNLARAMNISESQLTHIRHGALLHDIGKMGVPDHILLKADELTSEEWEKMRKHPEFAYEMLSSIRYLQPALDIPYCHHEKWDGTGYPRGLKGEEIPLTARIFAVADV
ncbi:MAG TPA: HD domain-containing phosphohydrolase, partial [Anaerolineales bacterium]|nr:HD domain-containing phosphohydrolase [Anaerolineales bacterium]